MSCLEKNEQNNNLHITCKIPLEAEPLIGTPNLTFASWLPLGIEKGITVIDGDIEVTLWFDLSTTMGLKEADIVHHCNVLVHHIKANIRVSSINDSLAAYIQNRDFSRLPTVDERGVQAEYEALGRRVLAAVMKPVNRLIAYVRAFKGQYWLVEYKIDPNFLNQYFMRFEAQAAFDEKSWVRFQPTVGDTLVLEIDPDSESTYISEEDWQAVTDFVKSEGRSPLVGELLASAEHLAGQGYFRSAITEAVTALEVALYQFGRSENAKQLFQPDLLGRMQFASLENQIKGLGLRGTVRFLLPILLPEQVLSTDIIKGCQKAVDIRNEVVHRGQREIKDEKLFDKSLRDIKQLCKILADAVK